jgi:hypothetical protein
MQTFDGGNSPRWWRTEVDAVAFTGDEDLAVAGINTKDFLQLWKRERDLRCGSIWKKRGPNAQRRLSLGKKMAMAV